MPRIKKQGTPYRRKRQGKTDYRSRLKQVISGRTRLVVRLSSKNVYAQLIEFNQDGDKVLASVATNELKKKYGWKGARRNASAAYLTGLLVGMKAKTKNIKEAILDIGMRSPIKGSNIYAVLKGAVDSGLKVPHSAEVLPKEERIKGTHIKNSNFDQVKTAIMKGATK